MTSLVAFLAAHWTILEPALVPALFGVAVVLGRFWLETYREEKR